MLSPALENLGFVALASDTEDDKMARSQLIARLGRLGHTETVGRCWMLWHQERAGKLELDKDIQRAVYATVARGCKWDVTEQLMTMYRDTGSAETRRVLRCLAGNTDTEVAARVLDWMMGDVVKLQDKTFFDKRPNNYNKTSVAKAKGQIVKNFGRILQKTNLPFYW